MVLGRLYHEWDRPGYGERLLLPLMTPEGEPQGLLGITVCKLTFDSRLEAEQRARRVTVILPLDGSPASEETQIGRASCRESVCQYVEISAVAVSLQKKISLTHI